MSFHRSWLWKFLKSQLFETFDYQFYRREKLSYQYYILKVEKASFTLLVFRAMGKEGTHFNKILALKISLKTGNNNKNHVYTYKAVIHHSESLWRTGRLDRHLCLTVITLISFFP